MKLGSYTWYYTLPILVALIGNTAQYSNGPTLSFKCEACIEKVLYNKVLIHN